MHTVGLLFYVLAMWVAGVMQGLMWRATNADGSLKYAFIDGLIATHPWYILRLVGGLLVVAGMGVMAWNLWHTASDARKHLISPSPVPIPEPTTHQVPAPLPASA
jgi:cytochrome c oxidase cbb3-type subunit 1